MLEEITTTIGSLGFPIAVCVWFMFRIEPLIKGNTKAINRNSTVLENIKRKK